MPVPVLEAVGPVADTLFADLMDDARPELILACELGPIRVFSHSAGQWTEQTAALGLEGFTGWWNSLAVVNGDGDGHLDLLLAQNLLTVRPEDTRLDARRGLLLRGDGRGAFTAIPIAAREMTSNSLKEYLRLRETGLSRKAEIEVELQNSVSSPAPMSSSWPRPAE